MDIATPERLRVRPRENIFVLSVFVLDLPGRFASRIVAGNARRVALEWIKPASLKSLAGELGLRNAHLAAPTLVNHDLDRRDHRLTRVFVKPRLPVVEDVPLPADLADASVRVPAWMRRRNGCPVRAFLASTPVYDRAAVCPRSKRRVGIRIGERVMRAAEAELAVLRLAAIHEDVLALNLAQRRTLEETEVAALLESTNHVLDDFRALSRRRHGLRVKFRAARPPESPVAIRPAVIVHKHRRIVVYHANCPFGVCGIPVADLERPFGTTRLGDHRHAPFRTAMREKPIRLLAGRLHRHRNVRRVEQGCKVAFEKRLAFRVFRQPKRHAIETPLARRLGRCRPYDQVSSAIARGKRVVRSVEIDSAFAGIVGIFEHVGFAVRHELPKRQYRVCRPRRYRRHRYADNYCNSIHRTPPSPICSAFPTCLPATSRTGRHSTPRAAHSRARVQSWPHRRLCDSASRAPTNSCW